MIHNKMKRAISFPFLMFLLLSACAPQAELVKTQSDISGMNTAIKSTKTNIQEIQKRLDVLEADVKQTANIQGVVADTGARFDQLTTDLQIVQGKVEENNFRLSEFAQKFDDRMFKIAELNARIEELEAKVKKLEQAPSVPPAEKENKAEAKALAPSDAYRQAKEDYDKKNYDLAIEGFKNYLTQFPDASQADKAQYWIGECYYSKSEYGKAIEAFSRVVKNHPKSDKRPGAEYKVALSYLNEKNSAKAREYLKRVMKEYPRSKEARLAKEKLHSLGK